MPPASIPPRPNALAPAPPLRHPQVLRIRQLLEVHYRPTTGNRMLAARRSVPSERCRPRAISVTLAPKATTAKTCRSPAVSWNRHRPVVVGSIRMRGSLAVATVGLMLACTGSRVSPPAPARVDLDSPATFSLNGAQAGQVAAVVNLVRAYNGGRIDEALALLDEQVGISDCDYRKVRVVTFSGRSEAEGWLSQRVADHDRLQLQSIWNLNPGDAAVGVVWALRSSDSLKSRGFPKGILPQLDAKVVFDPTTNQITRFANGPYGGDQRSCRPTVAEPSAGQAPRLPEVTSGSRDPAPGPFVISATKASNVATLVSFVAAYHSGSFDSALSLLADQVAGSDCDHSTGRVVSFKGRDQAAAWLGERLASHDRLDIVRVYNASGQPHVVGVAFAGRPNDFAKVAFADGRILGLGLAGSGGSC